LAVAAVVEIVLIEKFRFDISLKAEFHRITIDLFIYVLDDEDDILEVLLPD
jgi:hypothetical protein